MSIRDRVRELRRVRAGDLIANEQNWRTHPEEQRSALNAMLEEIGFAGAIICREDEGGGLVIIDGHLRSDLDPDAELPVLVTDLDEAEAAKLLATYDPIGAMAGSDPELLLSLLSSITTDSAEVGELLKRVEFDAGIVPKTEGKTSPDDVPELVEPHCKLGDLWALGEHRLLCGDSTDEASIARVMAGDKAVLFSTDPPYVVGYTGHRPSRSTGEDVGKDWSAVYHEIDIPDAGAFYGAFTRACWPHLREDAAWYLWHGHKWAGMIMDLWSELGVLPHQQIVWVKPSPMFSTAYFNWRHETCLFGWREGHRPDWADMTLGAHTTSVWELTYDGGAKKQQTEHPTQKPVEVFALPMRIHTRPGDIVLEPFSGSGSQLIAAEQEQRRCRAVELEPRFVDVAIRRWEQFSGKTAELLEAGST